MNSIEILNLISFNRLKNNIELIKNLIVDNFIVYDIKYVLKGIICYPFSGHYNGLIINMADDSHLLKQKYNYFCDDTLNDNCIKEITDDWENKLNNNYPNILIYLKE